VTLHLGNVAAGSTIYVPFHTFDANGASVTISGLATTDIEIYKNGSTTERGSEAGYTLLDTDGIDFGGKTGIHGFSIDLSDNTDAGFYAAGSWYWVVVASITVNTQTVNFVAATFKIIASDPLQPTVAGRTLDVSAGGDADAVVQSIAAGAITAAAIATDAIDADAMADGTITAATFAADAITATVVADGTIDAATFAANAITATVIADGAIDANTFAASAITATAIASNALTSAKIAADAITPTQIKSVGRGTVDAGATTTSIPTSACTPAGAAEDQFAGRVILFDDDTSTAELRGQATSISASSNAAAPTFTVVALTTAPSAGDLFSIV